MGGLIEFERAGKEKEEYFERRWSESNTGGLVL
jgi:hypothetical protein